MLLFHPPYHFVELNMGQPFRGEGPLKALRTLLLCMDSSTKGCRGSSSLKVTLIKYMINLNNSISCTYSQVFNEHLTFRTEHETSENYKDMISHSSISNFTEHR